MIRPLLPPRELAELRSALVAWDFTADGLAALWGPAGQAALGRGDLDGVRRLTRGGSPGETLVRLFLLGGAEPLARASAAGLPVDAMVAAGLLRRSAAEVRAGVDLRPYQDWWVISDLGADVREGPLAADHVLGVGAAALSLARATVRTPVGRAADIGTGCGVQALHLSGQADTVVATDISPRALRFAATTAALSDVDWDLRCGDFLDPLAGDAYDLVVANLPFVVGPSARAAYDYRDSGRPGDEACARLVRSMPGVLAAGGTAQLLANWAVADDEPWEERVGGWLAGTGCDAWVWQREVADPGEYAALWLRDAGERPGTERWRDRYDEWLDWFEASGVAAIGMGLISLRRTGSSRPVVVCEDVRQPIGPTGSTVDDWFVRNRWLAEASDDELLATGLIAADGLVRSTHAVRGTDGWRTAATQLRQAGDLRWEIEADEAVAALVAGCTGAVPLRTVLGVLGAALDTDVAVALLPVVRDLLSRGLLMLP